MQVNQEVTRQSSNPDSIPPLKPSPRTIDISAHLPARSTPPLSDLRRVFTTTPEMRNQFSKFLSTIFYQLDEKQVFALMDQLLSDPTKTDEQVYEELLAKIHTTKKTVPMFSKLWSLFVLKKGMGEQANALLKDFRKDRFHDYMEVYDRRYIKTIRGTTGMPLDGQAVAVCDCPETGMQARIQAGALFSKYPYKQHVPLNEDDCTDPLLQPDRTYRPLGDEVTDSSIDLVAAFGGLHHCPIDRADAFLKSVHSKLRPGGVVLLREHDISGPSADDVRAIAAVVHTFVNATDGVSSEIESCEVREFKSAEAWTQLMGKNGFSCVSDKTLVLQDDPTNNAMMAFVKDPQNLSELRQSMDYRSDGCRPKDGTRATWIEWGNVRYSQEYADYVQDHHSHAFDFIGHLRQHWQHFSNYVKESLKDKVSLWNLIFSDNMAMNVFILLVTTLQCGINAVVSAPNQLVSRWRHGENWRDVCNLTALEKFEARNELEYSRYLEHTPFYMYDYIGKMKEMWRTIWNSNESFGIKAQSYVSATVSSLGFLAKAGGSAPIRAFYTSDANLEPDIIKIIVSDPDNELQQVIDRWENEKDPVKEQNRKIVVTQSAPDGHKVVSLPRYRPFTKICGYLEKTNNLKVIEIGGQEEISIDLLLDRDQSNPQMDGARVVYEMNKLQDKEHRRYVTYQVNVCALKQFHQLLGGAKVVYIHE